MFFHTQLLISTLLAVSAVLGAPSTKRQEAGTACDGLGSGAYSNRGNFRVAAFSPNGPNDHEYGTELIQGGLGSSPAARLTTFTAEPWDTPFEWVNHDMTNGGIATTAPGTGVSVHVSDNDWPQFVSTSPKSAPTEVWCGVPSNEVTGEHKWDYLAANGRYDLWSLCEETSSRGPSRRRVAYNVDKTKPNSWIKVDTCVSVYLTILT